MYGKYLENETFRTSSPNCYFCNFWWDKQTLVKHPFSTVEGKINCLYHSVKALLRLIHFGVDAAFDGHRTIAWARSFSREKGTLAKIVPKFHFFIHLSILLGRTLYQFYSIPVPLSLPAQSLSSQRKKLHRHCVNYGMEARGEAFTQRWLSHRLTYSLTYSLPIHALTYPPTHPITHSLTYFLTYWVTVL